VSAERAKQTAALLISAIQKKIAINLSYSLLSAIQNFCSAYAARQIQFAYTGENSSLTA